jgi:hypothetical protein
MKIDKSQILDLLRQQGDDDKARQAQQELPDQVDTDRDAGMLAHLGIDPQDLLAKVSGTGLGSGMASGLGGMLGGENRDDR